MTKSSKKSSKSKNRSKKSENRSPSGLLIENHRKEIIDAVAAHRVVIIVGQTGCGKSTQVPQYIHRHREQIGLRDHDRIVCLHPRSVAATSLAERVALECRTRVGTLVGYMVRFYTLCEITSRIVYMTAGFMTRLLSTSSQIEAYGVVIIDEAHQRSVDNDIVMGQMKMIMKKDDRVRLVIMSATLNIPEIQAYYPEAFLINIPPRESNVDVLYRTVKGNDYVAAATQIVKEIISSSEPGHILIFLPSEEKVWKCKGLLKEEVKPRAIVLPFYGAMDHEDKMKVFRKYENRRKIIVATNIAETSLTIEGVQFVIDTGFVKRVHYDYESRVDRWSTDRVSAAEAEQRKGRAGRTGEYPGKCYRLYDKYNYRGELSQTLRPFITELERTFSLSQLRIVAENLEAIEDVSSWGSVVHSIQKVLSVNIPKKDWVSLRFPVPEISIANLSSTVLTMKLRKVNILTFPFIVAPDPEHIKNAIVHLKELSLLQDNGDLTHLGTNVARLPLNPTFGKVAYLASDEPCREDVFIVIAMLSRPILINKRKASHDSFNSLDGDLVKLFCVFEKAEINGFSKEWCKEYGVIFSNLNYCKLIYAQLSNLLPTKFNQSPRSLFPPMIRIKIMKEVFLSGFFQHLSVNTYKDFRISNGKSGTLHQNSCVDKRERYILPILLQSSSGAKTILMKDCMAYDKAMLNNIDPRSWRIRADLWRNVLNGVGIKQKSK